MILLNFLVVFLLSSFSLITKKQLIYKLHGISLGKILKNVTLSAAIPLLIGGFSAYIISVVYLYVMNFRLFLTEISLYFVLIASVLMAFYLSCLNLVVFSCLRFSRQMAIMKGNQYYQPIQCLTHLLKLAFSILLLMSFSTTTTGIARLNTRLAARTFWETTQAVYRVNFSVSGRWDFATHAKTSANARKMYDYLTANYDGFFIDADQINAIVEGGFFPFVDSATAPPLAISPFGYRITISPSFLEINPIEAVNGIEIEDQLIWHPYVKNLLVPQAVKPYEKIFSELYLEQFYFDKVEAYNAFAESLNVEALATTIDELSLNVIYVNDNQCYFTFNAFLMQSTGGLICNPIAVVFNPDNLNSDDQNSYVFGILQHSFYFRSYADQREAFASMQPAISRYEVAENLRFITPVYHEFVLAEQALTQQLTRLIILTVILVISSIAVTYYLLATYFEANQFKLVVKRNFGYQPFKRH